MNAITGYKGTISEVRSLMSRSKFSEALAEVDALLEQWPDQPALLVLRGELIQLQDENGPPLDEAVFALKRAATLDPRNADALLELAYFQFAVQDDSRAAEKSFSRSISASSEALISALVGRAGALEELGRKREAFDCLLVARYLQSSESTRNGSTEEQVDLFERFESLVGPS